jgi:hypothetical protein
VVPRAGLGDVEKRKFLTLPGLELQTLCRPAHSQSLYRLRYPGSYYATITAIIIADTTTATIIIITTTTTITTTTYNYYYSFEKLSVFIVSLTDNHNLKSVSRCGLFLQENTVLYLYQ